MRKNCKFEHQSKGTAAEVDPIAAPRQRSPRAIDRTGERYVLLKVTKEIAKAANGAKRWECICDCGKTAYVRADCLVGGATRSCGCATRKWNQAAHTTHGQSGSGKDPSPEYAAWAHIVQRCTNPNNRDWKNYGGRGIRICDEWVKDFSKFKEHVGSRPHPSLTIDRIDNEGHYEPNNVRWATRLEQSANQRKRRTRHI